MILRTLFRYGVPTSFVYCTIYQQNIWREGDNRLIEEQKRVWRDTFIMIDRGYDSLVSGLKLSSSRADEKTVSLVSKFDSMDLSECWNNRVQNLFKSVDSFLSNPMATACRIYRKAQLYVSNPDEATGKVQEN